MKPPGVIGNPSIWDLPVKWPWVIILVSILLALLAVSVLSRLKPSSLLENMFSSDNPTVQAYLDMQASLASKDELVIVVHDSADDHSSQESKDRLVAFARRLKRDVESSESPLLAGCEVRFSDETLPDLAVYYEEVVVPHALHYLSSSEIDAFLKRFTPERISAQIEMNQRLVAAPGSLGAAISDQVLNDPLRLYEFLAARLSESGSDASLPWFSPDGRRLLLRITGSKPVGDMAYTRAFVEQVRDRAGQLNPDALELGFTGAYPIAELSERSIRGDMITSVFSTVVLLFGVFFIAYRSSKEYLVSTISIGIAILVAFGLYSLLQASLNPATAVAGAILAGLGVDYSVHVLSHVSHESLVPGRSSRQSIACALSKVVAPVAIASMTTIIAFIAVSRSSVQALREFSLLAAIGIGCSMVAALILLPALMVVLRARPRAHRVRVESGRGFSAGLVRTISRVPVRTVVLACLGWSVFLMVSWLLPANTSSGERLSEMHPHPNPPLQLQAEIDALFNASEETMFVWIDSDGSEDLVSTSWDVVRRLKRDDASRFGVVSTVGLPNLLPDPGASSLADSSLGSFDVEGALEAFDAAIERSIFDPAAYDDYASFLRRLLTRSEPPCLEDLARYPGIHDRLVGSNGSGLPGGTVVVVGLGGERPDMDQVIPWLDHEIDGIPGATLTGFSAIGLYLNHAVGSELLSLLSLALVIILLFLLMIFRNPFSILLVLLPCLFALPFVFATMRLLGLEFNMINVIGFPLLVGIGIDDGIFLVCLARHARRHAFDLSTLLDRFRSVCHAMLVTSATTILAFGSLVFTSTPAIQSLGIITAVGVVGCLLSTVVILLPILLLIHPGPHGPDGTPSPGTSNQNT